MIEITNDETNIELSFIPHDMDHEEMPFLSSLMSEVENFVQSKIAEYHAGDKNAEIRRFLAGRIARQDLLQMRSAFQCMSKKECTPWNALVAIESENLAREGKKLSFKNDMPSVKRKYDNLEADAELLESVTKKRQQIESGIKSNKNGARVEKYKSDLNALKHNAETMFTNYGTHMIVVGANNLEDLHLFTDFIFTAGRLLYYIIFNHKITFQ